MQVTKGKSCKGNSNVYRVLLKTLMLTMLHLFNQQCKKKLFHAPSQKVVALKHNLTRRSNIVKVSVCRQKNFE